MSLFRERILARLLDRHAISRELVHKLLAWRHPGFSAHVGEPIDPHDKQRLEDTAAYLVRNPISLKGTPRRPARLPQVPPQGPGGLHNQHPAPRRRGPQDGGKRPRPAPPHRSRALRGEAAARGGRAGAGAPRAGLRRRLRLEERPTEGSGRAPRGGFVVAVSPRAGRGRGAMARPRGAAGLPPPSRNGSRRGAAGGAWPGRRAATSPRGDAGSPG